MDQGLERALSPTFSIQPSAASTVLAGSSTVAWLARAAEIPTVRRRDRLPETLDFREYADLFLNTFHGAPPGTELGFPLVLRDGALHFPIDLTSQARYKPFMEGGRFIGTFHVHPASPGGRSAPFFDPQDLASALRSDNAGFMDLLLTEERLYALVRSNPTLYISAHHVNRNPLLLQEQHTAMLLRRGSPSDPGYAGHYRKASLYFFHQYDLALYEGNPRERLKRTVTPVKNW